jgi:protein NRD1
MAAIEELGAQLQSLQALKPPGVTKSKIDAITAKCVENVQVCRVEFVVVKLLSPY